MIPIFMGAFLCLKSSLHYQGVMHNSDLNTHGWALFLAQIDSQLLEHLRNDLEKAYKICAAIRARNGVDQNADGSAHHIVGLADSFLDFLGRRYLHSEISGFFGTDKYILNSFGGVVLQDGARSYLHNVHRDVRTFYTAPLMINMLVMLDDFTFENGATYVLSGSHLNAQKPNDEIFFARAERITGTEGSIALFDSRLWHSAGENKDGSVRRALTLNFTPPFYKQQLNYPEALGLDLQYRISDDLRQILGYKSMVPTSLDAWYQPRERRAYQHDQG
jgi:hypothetical protein